MVSFAGVATTLVHVARTAETFQVSGVGPYPRKATAEFFRSQCGGQIPVGLLRTVVPASPDAWCAALERWGTMRFADVVAPALECAAEGFPVSMFSAYLLARSAEKIRQFPSSAAIYLPGGTAPAPGDRIVHAELAETIREMMAAESRARRRGRARAIRAARDAFCKGDIALRIADYHAREGGLLAYEDLAGFGVEVVPALLTAVQGVRGGGVRVLVPGTGVPPDAEPHRALRYRRPWPQLAAYPASAEILSKQAAFLANPSWTFRDS